MELLRKFEYWGHSKLSYKKMSVLELLSINMRKGCIQQDYMMIIQYFLDYPVMLGTSFWKYDRIIENDRIIKVSHFSPFNVFWTLWIHAWDVLNDRELFCGLSLARRARFYTSKYWFLALRGVSHIDVKGEGGSKTATLKKWSFLSIFSVNSCLK